mgnify:CR=1 FL=1|tara:strand:- start:17019 stop:17426 length:408 start_codon:yes stop_codon:yes gene_type:complete
MGKKYDKGYDDGWYDGYQQGIEAGKKVVFIPESGPETFTCIICGGSLEHDFIYDFICNNPSCPASITTYWSDISLNGPVADSVTLDDAAKYTIGEKATETSLTPAELEKVYWDNTTNTTPVKDGITPKPNKEAGC